MRASRPPVAGAAPERKFSFRRGLPRPRWGVSLKLAAGLSILCGTAAAERAIEVELMQPAPFEAGQLAAAMRVRLPAEGAPVRVRISPIADGVRIDAAPGSRDVPLHGLSGPDAARMVALAASDLVMVDLAAAPELVVRGAAPAHRADDRIDGRIDDRIALGVTGALARWDGALATGALDLVLPRRRFVIALEAGGGTMPGGTVDVIAGVVRIDAGLRSGMFELRGGVTFAPLVVSTGAGDSTLLAGGNASARMRIPLTASTRAVLAAGADAFATRTTYLLDGMTALTTPRIAPWFAAGMEVAL